MPLFGRHNRLSGFSSTQGSNSAAPRKRRNRSRANSVEEIEKLFESQERVQRSQQNAERMQFHKYLEMAGRHMPAADVLAAMPEPAFRRFVVGILIAVFFRSACQSTTEIESLALKILGNLKSGEMKSIELEMTKSYVCRFLLGKCGVDVMDTLQPAIFDATKDLKRVYTADWSKDAAFTCYFKVDWELIKKIRGRLEEKLNQKIYPLFESRRGTKCEYDTALEKASQKISSKYVAADNLPKDFQLDYEFGRLVCKYVKMDKIMESWAADYGENVPRKAIVALPSILNSRAVHKQMKSISQVATEVISLLKSNREKAQQMHNTSLFSQPSLFLSQFEEELQDSDESLANDSLEEQTKKVMTLTLSSDDENEESSEDLFSDIYSTPSKTPVKPTFSSDSFPPPPSLPQKRKQSTVRSDVPKKRKANILDGLPSLESF